MPSKIFIIILLFFSEYTIQGQTVDSLSNKVIERELETIKQFRQKDSLRIAMLLNEIQVLIAKESSTSTTTSTTTNSVSTTEKEIEKLRDKMRGRPIVFEKDTLYYLYTSYGPYDIDTRVKYIEGKLNELYKDPSFIADSIKVKSSGDYLAVVYKDKIITGVTIVDALWEDSTQSELANRHSKIIRDIIVKYREQNSLKTIIIRIG